MNKGFLHKIGIIGLVLAGLLGALYWYGIKIDISFVEGRGGAVSDETIPANSDSGTNPTSLESTSITSDAPLSNPYRGWYQINQYYLSDTDFPDDTAIAESLDLDNGMRLSLAEYNLAEYADGALSERALAEIRTTFSIAKEQGVGLIVRFLYDWDGNAAATEPSDRSVIETHIRQVAPLINEYTDTIFCVQGLFVGDYGEMHDSAFVNDTDMAALLNLLAEQVDPRIFLAVRTPEQWRNLTGVSNPSRSRQTELSSRVGLFNDGIMASDTDFGTYAEGSRAKELSFQNVLCQIVPNGGEVVGGDKAMTDGQPENTDRSRGTEQIPNISTVIDTLRTMRITYLNPEYDATVIDRWKQMEYEGQNAYDYIAAHLGYRYELAGCKGKVRHRFRDLFAPSVDFTITIDNTGFAPAYRRFEAELVVGQNPNKSTAPDETQEILSIPIRCNNREWLPNEPVALKARLTTKQLHTIADSNANSLSIWLRLKNTDNSEVIQFAKRENDRIFGIFLGELSIK